MARHLRLEFADALYHVTSRGNDQRSIFADDVDRKRFLGLLGTCVRRFGWSVTAYVLMTNHVHLVIQTPEPNLSRGMHWLNGTYASGFNRRHGRSGHLFQGRFHAFLVEKEAYFCEVLRYVVLNPVRAGMVARPEDYRWSSYRATEGRAAAPDWLDVTAALAAFGHRKQQARLTFGAFVQSKVGSSDRLWDAVSNAMYLGTEEWSRTMKVRVDSNPRSTDHPKLQRAIGRPKMHRILDAVADAAKLTRETVRSRAGGALRGLVAWLGWNEGLLTLRSIAAALRLRSEGHVSGLIRRCEAAFASDGVLLARLDAATAALRG